MKTVNLTGIVGESVELLAFVMMDFVGWPRFLHSGVGVVAWGGEDWDGVGAFGSLDAVGDRLGYAPTRMRLSLSNPVTEYLNEALNENTWGRLGEVYIGGWEGSGLSSAPSLMLRGKMGPPEVVVGKSSKVAVMLEDVRAMMDRINGLRSTILEHQVQAPGDTFFRWLPKMVDHRFVFNGGEFGGNNFTPADPSIRPVRPPGTFIR